MISHVIAQIIASLLVTGWLAILLFALVLGIWKILR